MRGRRVVTFFRMFSPRNVNWQQRNSAAIRERPIPRRLQQSYSCSALLLPPRLNDLQTPLPLFEMRRGVVKGGQRRNYFAALDDLDRPSVVFAPSILAGFGTADSPAASAFASEVPAPRSLLVVDAPRNPAGFTSLASVAEEIDAATKSAPGGSGTWNFSGLGGVSAPVGRAASSAQPLLAELESSHDAFDAHVIKVAEKDREAFGAKLARADLSRKQRVRRLQDAVRGEAFGHRLSGKVAKHEQAQRRRNQAKGGR